MNTFKLEANVLLIPTKLLVLDDNNNFFRFSRSLALLYIPSIAQRTSSRIQQKRLVLPDAFSCALHGRFVQRMHMLSYDLLACHLHAYHGFWLVVELAQYAAHADCFDYFVGDSVGSDVDLVYADSVIKQWEKRISISQKIRLKCEKLQKSENWNICWNFPNHHAKMPTSVLEKNVFIYIEKKYLRRISIDL